MKVMGSFTLRIEFHSNIILYDPSYISMMYNIMIQRIGRRKNKVHE